MTKSMEEQVKQDLIKSVKRETISNEIMIGYYKQVADKEEDSEKKAKTLLKVKQMEETLDFNKKFLEYVEQA